MLDLIDRLPRQPRLGGDPRDPHLAQHGPRMVELSARIARLAPKVRSVTVLLRMLDTGPLSGLGRFGLPERWRP